MFMGSCKNSILSKIVQKQDKKSIQEKFSSGYFSGPLQKIYEINWEKLT